MERSDVSCTVTEECRRHLAAARQLRRKTGADGDRQTCADDPGSSDQIQLWVCEMHRAAEPAAHAGAATEYLRERGCHRHAARDADTVAAVRVCEIVVCAQRAGHTCTHGLLAYAQVCSAIDQAFQVRATYALLELSDAYHSRIHLQHLDPALCINESFTPIRHSAARLSHGIPRFQITSGHHKMESFPSQGCSGSLLRSGSALPVRHRHRARSALAAQAPFVYPNA